MGKNLWKLLDSHGNILDNCPDLATIEKSILYNSVGFYMATNKETGEVIQITASPVLVHLRSYGDDSILLSDKVIEREKPDYE